MPRLLTFWGKEKTKKFLVEVDLLNLEEKPIGSTEDDDVFARCEENSLISKIQTRGSVLVYFDQFSGRRWIEIVQEFHMK